MITTASGDVPDPNLIRTVIALSIRARSLELTILTKLVSKPPLSEVVFPRNRNTLVRIFSVTQTLISVLMAITRTLVTSSQKIAVPIVYLTLHLARLPPRRKKVPGSSPRGLAILSSMIMKYRVEKWIRLPWV